MASPTINTATIKMIRRMEPLSPGILARRGGGIIYRHAVFQKAAGRSSLDERPVKLSSARRMVKTDVQQRRSERCGETLSLPYVEPLSDARTKLMAVFTILLRADADSVFNHVERLLRHEIFGNQFALHLVRPVVDDPIRHVFRQSQ